jgi:hypothetical protein
MWTMNNPNPLVFFRSDERRKIPRKICGTTMRDGVLSRKVGEIVIT